MVHRYAAFTAVPLLPVLAAPGDTGGVPGWVWGVSGLLIGAAIGLVVVLRKGKGGGGA